MGRQFGAKWGLKRCNVDGNQYPRKNQHKEQIVAHSPSPSTSGDSADRESSGVASQEVVYKEPTVYDNLLMKLGTSSKSLANAYKIRQRQEEGRSESEEDEVDGSESLSVSEKDDGDSDDGTDSEFPGSPMMESRLQEDGMVSTGEQSEDAEIEVDSEASDTEEEHGLGLNVQSSVDAASTRTSSFNEHFGYNLSKKEADDLSKKKWKYEWEVPAVDMSNCKWTGTGECFLKDVDLNSDFGVKTKLYKHWLDIYNTSGGNDLHLSKQRHFFSLFNSYRDILHCNKKPFYLKDMEEDSSIMDAYLMHSLNHIFRTRDLVTKNDAKVAKNIENSKEEMLIGGGFLDQGFTRPKVMILLPLRSIALNVVKRLIRLTPKAYKANVEHFDRFCAEFGTGEEEGENDKNESSQNFDDNGKSNSQKSSKPSDFQMLFGGNNDDDLMIGIKFTRRSIKLYNDFYTSDMIVASAVNINAKIGRAEKNKLDVDYLSSIEVLIIDHADVISMQNWSLLTTAVNQLNRIPLKQSKTDVMRIRQWYLEGYAKFYRQTINLTYYSNPDITAFFNHHCTNYQGKVKLICEYKGVLPKVLLQVRQIYERFNADSIANADDARFEYFTKKVFPKIKDFVQGGIMLFISSYLEFVRIRNFLKSQNASFCLLGDYTEASDVSRAWVWFFEGKQKMILYTERAHFYHRYKIRGIQNLIIYSLPERKEFYPEIVNMLEGSHNMTCTALFSRLDQLRLERIVGSAHARRMVKSKKGVFAFC